MAKLMRGTRTEGRGFVGSRQYAAPETFRKGSEVRLSCDVYSFGAIMWEMYSGQRAVGWDR